MTGFGVASGEIGAMQLRIEVRSVNHRFLQIKTRLPSEISYLEPEVESVLKKRLERGAVSLTVHSSRAARPESLRVDTDVAKRYRKLLGKLAGEVGVTDDLALSHLIGLPGVLGGQDSAESELGRRSKQVLKLVDGAAAALVEMREAEGESLEKDLRKNAGSAAKVARRIGKRMPKVVKEHHTATKRRVEELLNGDRGQRRGQALSPADLAREVALLAERLDVEEELSRLASHLEQLDAVLAKGGIVGRKLDFLIQELQREANTIGSKCSDAQVAHAVVELKTLVERLREQVQNVE